MAVLPLVSSQEGAGGNTPPRQRQGKKQNTTTKHAGMLLLITIHAPTKITTESRFEKKFVVGGYVSAITV